MRKLVAMLALAVMVSGCASILPAKSPTKLEKSPCACDGKRTERHA